MPAVPEPVSQRSLAPDWVSPTQDNGVAVPPADLHIALLAPDRDTAELLRGRVRVLKPPYWEGGKVYLHVVLQDQRKSPTYKDWDMTILLALADMGVMDTRDLEIGPPADLTLGYPSGSDA